MILHVHKDHTDLLNETDVVNEFVGEDYGCLENSNKHCCVADNIIFIAIMSQNNLFKG